MGKRAKTTTKHPPKKPKPATTSEPDHPEDSTPTLHIGKAEIGEFVALRLAKYDDEVPQIAKVVAMDELNVTVQWWMGSFSDSWREWKEKKKVVEETFHRNAIIKSGITFTASKRLSHAITQELRKLYRMVEFM